MGDRPQPLRGFGHAVATYRTITGLTQAELAEVVTAVGNGTGHDLTREQVLHIEAGRRQVTIEEALYIAHALRVPLFVLLVEGGYGAGVCATAGHGVPGYSAAMWPEPTFTPAAMRAASGGAAAHMRGEFEATQAVAALMDSWRDYETRSGRPPSERAERAKRATLWKDYERDPAGFIARATRGGTA